MANASKTNIWPWTVQENLHPLHYINFPEYSKIITKKDNWRDIFLESFVDREILTSKLRELEPIRNKIAHMRDLSEEEKSKLLLFASEIQECIQ